MAILSQKHTGRFLCTLLDLVILSLGLVPYVRERRIDEEKKFTPFRVQKENGTSRFTYSDHYSIMVFFEGLEMKGKLVKNSKKVWNLAKEGGWERYKLESDNMSKKIEKNIDDKERNIEDTMANFNKLLDKVKYKAFGKVTIKDKIEIEDEKEDDVLKEQIRRADEEIR